MSTFLPLQLIERLSLDQDRPAQACWDGAALFADISGYTRLTERLSSAGPDGLERLSAIIDCSFGRYINVVAAHGGEVAYFAGDALLAWWPPDAKGATSLAVRCAWALTDLDQASTDEDQPGLHIGVASGRLVGARVGGTERRWEVVLGGTAVREACQAMSRGRRGEVVLSPSAADVLGRAPHAQLLADNYVRVARAAAQHDSPLPAPALARVATSAQLVERFVSEVIRDRNLEAAGEWQAELRTIACLFARIDGIDETRPHFLEQLQRAVATIHEIARARAGATGRLIIDDKGLVFMLPLGIPLSSHSDDPARAFRAGLELSAQLRVQGLSCNVGVASGRAFCGVIGNDVRRDYVVIGAPMNLAARLMEAADGCVLTAETPALPELSFESVAAVHAKGLAAPIVAYRVRLAQRLGTGRAPIRDRTAERARLVGALKALVAGTGSVFSLVADAGIGKSRLVEELIDEARLCGLVVAIGACDPAGQSAPYLCWRGVLASILGAAADAPASQVARLARDHASKTSHAELLPLLNDMFPLQLADTGTTAQLVGDHRALAVFQLFIALIAECVAGPLLVVIEDCHWMDSASFRLLDFLARHARDVLIVVTTRPGTATRELQPLHEHPHFTELRLWPLGKEDATQLLSDRLGGIRVSAAVAEIVNAATDGNPLFIREYGLLLRESGRIWQDSGCWEFSTGALALEDVPASVQRVISNRVDSLAPAEVQTLKVASVIGQSFSCSALQKLVTTHDVLPCLKSLELQELLTSSGPDDAKVYAFRHALVRGAVYELMLYEQRRGLHRAAAHVMELESQPDVAATNVLLVHHWSLAGEAEKTRHYADLAGTHALRLGAFREAISFIEQCLALSGPVPADPASMLRILRWRRMLSEAHAGLGDHAARIDQAVKALTLAGCVTHVPRRRAKLELLVRLARHVLWRDYGSRLWRASAPDAARAVEIAWSYWHLAEVSYFAYDLPALFTNTIRAIGHADRAGPSPALARAYTLLAGSLGLAGWERAARRYFARAALVAQQAEDPPALAYAQMVACLYLVGIGDFAGVRESADRCQELCRVLGNHVTWGNAQVVRFWMHHYRGEIDESRRAVDELLVRAERIGNRQQQAWALRRLALVELRVDAPQQAVLHLERSTQMLADSKDRSELMPTWGALALARLRAGAERDAIAAFETVLQMSAELGRPMAHGTLEGLSAIAEVALTMRAREPASERWQRMARVPLASLDKYRRLFPIGVPAYRLWSGVARALDGQTASAVREWQQGHKAAQRLGMRFEERRLAAELARVLIAK